MKNLILILCIICTLTLCGCNFGKKVIINIPKEFITEELTQSELEKHAKEQGCISATLNDDGTATYVMSEKKYKEFVKENKENAIKSLNDYKNSLKIPTVVDIQVNADFTTYSVFTTSKEVSFEEAFLPISLSAISAYYYVFSGMEVDNIMVNFINYESGNVIYSWNSKDLPQE